MTLPLDMTAQGVVLALLLGISANAGETAIVHWSFDEATDAAPIVDSVTGKAFVGGAESGKRTAGVVGNALELQGSHALHSDGGMLPDGLERLSISAWIRPVRFDRYNEIIRGETGESRILFAIQETGTILSLGLNVAGSYVECDAKVDPAVLTDGQWHFAVGTFDGTSARVYLDGCLIGKLNQPGKLSYSRECRYFIGSSNGGGEFWQGAIDELALEPSALAAETIAARFNEGIRSLERQSLQYAAALKELYPQQTKSFPETMTALRSNIIARKPPLPPGLRDALLRRLRADYPLETTRFSQNPVVSAASYLQAGDATALGQQARRLLEMLEEYKPLTPMQWAHLPAKEVTYWRDFDALLERFEAAMAKPDPAADPVLIDIILAAGNQIPLRPMQQEAVAPYVVPQTPEPRQPGPQQALEAIQNDWLFQADGVPTREHIAREINWTRELLDRPGRESSGPADWPAMRADLEMLGSELAQLPAAGSPQSGQAGVTALYFKTRQLKRSAMLANPVIDFQQILLVDMPYPAGSEWRHETRHRLGYMAVPGGQLLVLDGLSPGGKVGRILPQAPLHGAFWRPDISYDGQRVLLSYKPHNEKAFHIYEVNLNGTGLRQITSGIFDDLDPVYLPDGKNFAFSTTRGHTYVRCMPPTNAYVLARCGLDGENLYIISGNNEPDYLPSVMPDGRIIYTRWEYTDKPLWRCQSLWTMNPDGTQSNTFWGNQSVWPDLLKDARSIPNSRRVMFTGSAHHDWFAGSIGIIDPNQGLNFPLGLTKVTADVAWPESGNGPVDPVESTRYHAGGKFAAYASPYPLGERDFLVSANKDGKFSLYLMDTDGNRELIYEGVNNIFHAMPVRARNAPPVIADRIEWPTPAERFHPKPGIISSSNIYQGTPPELAGKAKFLRVLNIEPKTYTYWNQRPYVSTGPVVSMVQSDGVKRVLGTVPIQDDGSVSFEAPSGVALHFQLLDENHRALQTMRSFVNLMPGESRGCLGCHESQHGSASTAGYGPGKAYQQPPAKITPLPWAFDPDFKVDATSCKSIQQALDLAAQQTAANATPSKRADVARRGTSISYVKDVQPVLDRYCGKCHQGEGSGRKVLDLTRRPGFLMFDEPYVTLIGAPNWGAPGNFPTGAWGGGSVPTGKLPPSFGIAGTILVEAFDQRDPKAYATVPPMTSLSYKSKLIDIASTGRHDSGKVDPDEAKVDPVSLLRLILWVDTMCPYISDDEIRALKDPEFQGVDWLSIRPRLETAPIVVRPGPFRADGSDALDAPEVP